MNRKLARLLAILGFALAALMPAGPTQAEGGGPNNLVLVSTTGSGATDERSHTKVGSFAGDNVQSANIARARSFDCTDCRTVAVAVQVVLATGNPSTVAPKNLAVATNESCLRCTTYAFAYQYVVTTDGPVRLNRDARLRLADIRRRIAATTQSGLPPAELDVQLNALTDELRSTVDGYLERAGEDPEGRVREDDDTEVPAE